MDTGIDLSGIREGLIYFIVVVCSLALHEWGHAYVAHKLGDPTPQSEGRVTLSPLAHIDPIGTILVPLMGALGFFGGFAMIGWAKPVYTNPSYFRRGNFDSALVTLAGPGMNALLALGATLSAAVIHRMVPSLEPLLGIVVMVNVALLVFNMLPIPPLDGSKFFIYWFGMKEETYIRLAFIGNFALLLLINIPAFRQLVGGLIDLVYTPFALLLNALT